MAPPKTTLRLSDLEPANVGTAAGVLLDPLFERVLRDSGYGNASAVMAEQMPYRRHMEAITRYAQTGVWAKDHGFRLTDYRRLFDAAVAFNGYLPDGAEAVQLALDAALARWCIELGTPVPRVQLAALSGLSERRIRQIVEAREIRAPETGAIPAAAAREWLTRRRLAGFGSEAA